MFNDDEERQPTLEERWLALKEAIVREYFAAHPELILEEEKEKADFLSPLGNSDLIK